ERAAGPASRPAPSSVPLAGEVADRDPDPDFVPPRLVLAGDLRLEPRLDVLVARTPRGRVIHGRAHVLEVLAHLADQRRAADLAVPGHNRLSAEPLQLL